MTSAGVNIAWAIPACPPSTLRKNGGNRHALRGRGSLSCSCRAGPSDDLNFDRRDVLTGLMGLTAGGIGASNPHLAAAATTDVRLACKGNVVEDTLLTCKPTDPTALAPCPPPNPTGVVDFTLPSGPMRLRKPAHLADPDLVQKYRDAVTAMKALPESDPRSFTSQARIHEAYCDSHYKLSTSFSTATGAPFDVHFSWIFAPWHRMYIYFYERILGSLIGDDTFALPYWNWDAPNGMVLPAMFSDGDAQSNPLYDANRNLNHDDDYVILDSVNDSSMTPTPFDPNNPYNAKKIPIVTDNLSLIYHMMIRGGKGARCFHGEKFCTDDEPKMGGGTAGTLDRMAHTGVHIFVGDQNKCYRPHVPDDKGCGMDMGFFGTAAYDPVFYTHHANVDRMWHLWAHDPDLKSKGHRDFEDPLWLDTSFDFYDENSQLVRIRVRDVLDAESLGYSFQEREPMLWKDSKPTISHQDKSSKAAADDPPADFPLPLQSGQCVLALVVARQPKDRDLPLSLMFNNSIQFDASQICKFDVAINVPADQAINVGPQWMEYAGSFYTVPRSTAGGMKPMDDPSPPGASLELPLEDVLDDIEVKDGDNIYVVIVPRTSGITILDAPTIMPTVCDADYQEKGSTKPT